MHSHSAEAPRWEVWGCDWEEHVRDGWKPFISIGCKGCTPAQGCLRCPGPSRYRSPRKQCLREMHLVETRRTHNTAENSRLFYHLKIKT